MKRILFAVGLPCLFVLFLVPANLVAQDGGRGEINWVQGYVSAVGNGAATSGSMAQSRPLARRAAVGDALRNLLEIMKGVKIDSATTVENFVVSSDVIRAHVDGVVKGAHIVNGSEKFEPQPDGSLLVSLEMRVCITGNCGASRTSLVQVLADRIKPPAYLPPPAPPPPPTPPVPLPAVAASPKAYPCDLTKPVTGLVVNLEGLPFERVLLPVIVVEDKESGLFTVYSAKNVKPAVVRTYGVVRYADTVDQALQGNKQIGSNVLVIPVSAITKENMIVIKGNDRRIIFETTSHGNDYLADAKVVIANQ